MRKWIRGHAAGIVTAVIIIVILGVIALAIAYSVYSNNIADDFGKRCESQSGNVFYNKYFRICVKDDRVIIRENY